MRGGYMKTRETPAELAAYISLELRETDAPRLTYDDWTTIKIALRSETASRERQFGERDSWKWSHAAWGWVFTPALADDEPWTMFSEQAACPDSKERRPCPMCNASGFSGMGSGYGDVCPECGGQKYVAVTETVDLTADAKRYRLVREWGYPRQSFNPMSRKTYWFWGQALPIGENEFDSAEAAIDAAVAVKESARG